MRGLEAIAEQLRLLEVRDVFTFLSRDTCKLVAELSIRGVRAHHTRHEQVAVGMADGYWRAGGRVGVAIVGEGVGLTNSINALVTASKARSGVVVLTGFITGGVGVPGADAGAARLSHKYTDQRALLDSLGVRHVELLSPASAAADIRACFESARSGGGAVVVNMPHALLEGPAGDPLPRPQVDAPSDPIELSEADKTMIVDLIQTTWASHRIVILAGRGAVRSGARTALLHVAEATGALLGTTVMGKGMFSGSPYAVGVVGTFATPVASELLQSADLVLSFGASLNDHTTYLGSIFGKARIIQIDDDGRALGRYRSVDLGVVADARLAAMALADELQRRGHRAVGYRTEDTAARIATFRIEDSFTDRSTAVGLDPRTLMVGLNGILPPERTVVVDGGNHMEFPIKYLAVPDPTGFVWPIEYAAIGCALGNALGAAVARPERLTVLCIGDGGLMMTLADIDTAVRYRLRVVVVVSDNAALGAELYYLQDHGYVGDDARSDNPSFEAVARSLGLESATVRTIAELGILRDRLAGLRGPMLVDCKITNDVQADFRSVLDLFDRKRHQRELAELTTIAERPAPSA